MKTRRLFNKWVVAALLAIVLLILAGCAAATQPAATEAPATEEMPTVMPTQTVEVEKRVVEMEWPTQMHLGDSDIIRLSLVPSADGYTATVEYKDHSLESQSVQVKRPEGYILRAAARLNGVNFAIEPAETVWYPVNEGEPTVWRWSIAATSAGRQRLTLHLLLRWEPEAGNSGDVKEAVLFDRGLEIQVLSWFGMNRNGALWLGLIGIALSGSLGLLAGGSRRRWGKTLLQERSASSALRIESGAGIQLGANETQLLRALFGAYKRLILQNEFQSGYSGARTFLAHPVKEDGIADAETIIKMGRREDIVAEYEHYDTYVKKRLPPITARIQSVPISVHGSKMAALQYTCISEAGKPPVSLRQTLLREADPVYFQRLFDAFGPYWWLQRTPFTFRMEQEYDRLLPPHLVLEPCEGAAKRVIKPEDAIHPASYRVGEIVELSGFKQYKVRADGESLTLIGQPQMRLRWLDAHLPKGGAARVVSTRREMLLAATQGFNLFGLPDPLEKLEVWLQTPLTSTRSVIHGDLNLENVLVGPGELVWLIDFAETREGHTLFDFSHLAAEVIAQVIAPRYKNAKDLFVYLQRGSDPLLNAIERLAGQCQFNVGEKHEYRLALALACIGGLKYRNLSAQAKQALYLAAALSGE
ncbi:MAG: phosphotransferase [Anaerolineaceae bacterium]|nr:phosphotransferase [Anaerolineaceae bacterium]